MTSDHFRLPLGRPACVSLGQGAGRGGSQDKVPPLRRRYISEGTLIDPSLHWTFHSYRHYFTLLPFAPPSQLDQSSWTTSSVFPLLSELMPSPLAGSRPAARIPGGSCSRSSISVSNPPHPVRPHRGTALVIVWSVDSADQSSVRPLPVRPRRSGKRKQS